MPKPIYIICSETGSEDKDTGLLSLFNLIDTLQITKAAKGMPLRAASPITQLRITACWLQESGDEDKEFEIEVAVISPVGEETILGRAALVFATKFCRISARVIGLFPIKGEGMFWIEARIRKTDSNAWQVNKTPLFVEQLPSSTAEVPASPELVTSVELEAKEHQPPSTK